jgi:hypothetical protein
MITLKELFPNIVILALDKRYATHTQPLAQHIYDRFHITSKIFLAGDGEIYDRSMYGHIDVPHAAPRLPGSTSYPTWDRPNCYNAFLCQQKMAAMAKSKAWESVLFLEDDMFFEVQTETTLAQLGEQIKTMQWKLLYIGFCAPEDRRPDLNRLDGPPVLIPAGSCCGGFHCVAIKNTAYDEIINMPALAPMDAMADRISDRWAIVPKLGEQKPGYSYVEQVNFTRPLCAQKLELLHQRWPYA